MSTLVSDSSDISSKKENRLLNILIDLGLIVLGAALFALPFPGFFNTWGIFPIAFIALVPFFIVIHRSSWITIFIYGAVAGYLSYVFLNYWLANFHPLAIIIVPVIYTGYFIVLFPILKAAGKLFPKYGFLVQMLIWVVYEFLKTQGFLGYSYGVLGLSQYLFIPFIQFSDITGVWGVSLMVVFPSAWLGHALKYGFQGFKDFFKQHTLELVIYGVLFLGVLIYGFAAQVNYDGTRMWEVALVQQNVDPWKNDNVDSYDTTLDALIELSNKAKKEEPEIIIWSETSFVPAIDYHTRFRTNNDSYMIVKRLMDFLKSEDIPYVIGNDHAEMKKVFGGMERFDYNSAMLYDKGERKGLYRKIHLVPFTENFPFEKELPGIYKWLKDADTHFWEPGTEYTVFEQDGVRFSTPICFEDTFGYLSRRFVNQGAQVLVNLTNDSWSKSVASEMQHMAFSVFRAVENKRSVLRSTNGGMTCSIDPNGVITSMLDPFVRDYLITEVPVYDERETLYTRLGDWFAYICLLLSAGLILYKIIERIIKLFAKED